MKIQKILYFKLFPILPLCAIVSSLMAISILYVLHAYDYIWISLIVLLPTIIVSLYFTINKKIITNIDISTVDFVSSRTGQANILVKIYLIIFLSALIWLLLGMERDIIFISFIVILYSIIIIQLFRKNLPKTLWIIIELILTSSLLILSKCYVYAYSYNSTDILVLLTDALSIYNLGHVPSSEIMYMYANFPTYHILVVMSSYITNLNFYTAIAIIGTISVLVISIVCVYYITLYIVNSKKIALMSIFFYSILPASTRYFDSILPRIFFIVLLFILLYLFLCKREVENIFPFIILGVICAISMTLYHHAMHLLSLGIVTILCAIYLLYSREIVFNKFQKIMLFVFYSVSITYIIYNFMYYSVDVISSNFFSFFTQETDIVSISLTESTNKISQYIYNLSTGFFITLFCLIGIYYLLSPKFKGNKVGYIGFLSLLFVVIFVPGVLDVTNMSHLWQIERIQALLNPLFAIVIAIGCVLLYYILAHNVLNNTNIATIFVILLCVLFVISSPILLTTKDSTVFYGTDNYMTRYYDEDDIKLINTIENYVPLSKTIYSDYPITRMFEATLGANYYGSYNYVGKTKISEFPEQTSYIILRNNQYLLNNWYLDWEISNMIFSFSPKNKEDKIINLDQYNIVNLYNNGESFIFFTP